MRIGEFQRHLHGLEARVTNARSTLSLRRIANAELVFGCGVIVVLHDTG
jgi:hypothetical protein